MVMPKPDGHPFYPQSRDYCLPTIPCEVHECPCNVGGKCEIPSAISINSAGRCETGVRARHTPVESEAKAKKGRGRRVDPV